MNTRMLRIAAGLALAILLCASCPGAIGEQAMFAIGDIAQPAARPPAGKPAAAVGSAGIPDLHIPHTTAFSWGQSLNDAGGYIWTISTFNNANSNRRSAVSAAMWLWINNQSPGCANEAWINQAGDEVETGSTSCVVSGLQIYRRTKIYKDAALARWLDAFENTTGTPVTFTVRLGTNLNWSVGRILSNSGQPRPAEKDCAFILESPVQGDNYANVLHILGSPTSRLRPQIAFSGSQATFDYTLTVPAHSIVFLCHFVSQNSSLDDMAKDMKAFRASRYMKDLSWRIRSRIANFPANIGGLADLDLERSAQADTIVLGNGDLLHGTIINRSYKVHALLGDVELPAEKVIGMAAPAGQEDAVRFLLVDGQVISGRTPEGKLSMDLSCGGRLDVPMADVRSWAHRVSKTHPEEISRVGPMVFLRTGDQLAFDPAATKMTFRTRQGPIDIKADEMLEIALDASGNGMHRASLVNGTRLGGLLEPDRLSLALKLGQKLETPRDLIVRIHFADEEKPDNALTRIVLSNDDEVMGRIMDKAFTLVTDFGDIEMKPDAFRTMALDPDQPGRIAFTMWNGSVHRGRLKEEAITVQIAPGPRLSLPCEQIRSVTRPPGELPDDLRKEVEKLAARLGSDNFKEREAATSDLARMGAAILPLLKKHAQDDDAEIRRRVGEIIEKIGAAAPEEPAPAESVETLE
jgi:hypothetical protein